MTVTTRESLASKRICRNAIVSLQVSIVMLGAGCDQPDSLQDSEAFSDAGVAPMSAKSPPLPGFDPGGSNYRVWSAPDGGTEPVTGLQYPIPDGGVGDYTPEPVNGDSLNPNGAWRPALYTNLTTTNPPTTQPAVVQQLQTMCANGQRKISLMLRFDYDVNWIDCNADFQPWGTPENPVLCPHWNGNVGDVVNSKDGQLTSQRVRDNISNMVALVVAATTPSGAACFNEIQFRFAGWNNAGPNNWLKLPCTNPVDPECHDGLRPPPNYEAHLENNWGVIQSVRSLVYAARGSSPIKIYFDLLADASGLTEGDGLHNMTLEYSATVWWRYLSTYGIDDTYGFTPVATPERMINTLMAYDAAGTRPPQHALDVYRSAVHGLNEFRWTLETLNLHGEGGKPILIQETYYNDDAVMREIYGIASELGFPIRTAMQWPITTTGSVPMTTPAYANNLPRPIVSGTGLGCSDLSCIWVTGRYIVGGGAPARVDLYSPSWTFLGSVPSPTFYPNGDQVAFGVPAAIRNQYPGVRVAVVNRFGRWNDPVYVSITP